MDINRFHPTLREAVAAYHDDQTFPREIRAELRAYVLSMYNATDLGHVLYWLGERNDWTPAFGIYMYELLKNGYWCEDGMEPDVFASLMELITKLIRKYGCDVTNYIAPQFLPSVDPSHTKREVLVIINRHDSPAFDDMHWKLQFVLW